MQRILISFFECADESCGFWHERVYYCGILCITEDFLFLLSSEGDKQIKIRLSSVHALRLKQESLFHVIVVECVESDSSVCRSLNL